MRNTVLLYIGLLVICAGIIPKCNATTTGEDLDMATEPTTLPPLGEPENVQANGESTTTIRVLWEEADGNPDKYTITGNGVTEKSVEADPSWMYNVTVTVDSPGTTYTITVTAIRDADVAEKAADDITASTMPKPPIDVELSPIDTGSIQVEWKAPDEGSASKYFGKACAGDDCLEQELTQGPAGDTISGLTAGTLYIVTMLSQFEDLNSTETEGKTQATMPEAPTDVTITVTGEDTMDITWTSASSDHKITITGKPCNPSLDEQGGCDSDCDGHGSIADIPVTGTEYIATDLYAGRLYEVTVKAVENGVDSEPSVPSSNRTEPKPPASVTEKSTTTTTATLTITPPPPFDLECTQSSEFKGYKIRGVKDDDIYVPSNSAENVDHEIKELKDATEFQYTVVTVSGDSDVESDPIDGLIFKTKLYPATDLVLTSDSNSITLRWQGQGAGYTYSVECKDSDGNGNNTGTTTEKTFTFYSLTHGEEYTCTVVSVQPGFEQDGKIEEKNILLNPFKPTLTVTPINTTSLSVNWTKEGLVDSNTLTYNGADWPVDDDVTVTTITSLEPNGVYVIVLEVTSGNNTETGNATSQTLSNAVALQVDTDKVNPKDITLNWGFPDGNAAGSLLYAYHVKVLNDADACLKSYLLVNDQEITSSAEPPDCDPLQNDPRNIAGDVVFDVTELLPCTSYKFEVIPINTVIAGDSDKTPNTGTDVGAPEEDVELVIGEETSTSIPFSWKTNMDPQNCGKRTNITIMYNICGTSDTKTIEISNFEGNTTTQSVPQPKWEYTVKVEVFSVNSEGGNPSNKIHDEQKATTAAGVPGAPTGVNYKDVTHDTTTVTWDPLDNCTIHGEPDKYTLKCSYEDPLNGNIGDEDPITIEDTGATSKVLDLKIYKNYTCELAVSNEVGESSPSSPTDFQTGEWIPNKLDTGRIEAEPSNAHIDLKWQPPTEPNGNIIRSVICWRLNDSFIDPPVCENSTDVPGGDDKYSFRIPGLKPFQNYVYHVATCTIVDCSVPSDVLNKETTNGMSDSTSVHATANGPHAINITWVKPGITADVTDYRVLVYDDDDDALKCNITNRGYDNNSAQCTDLEAWWGYRVQLEIITYANRNRAGEWLVNSDSNPAHTITGEDEPGTVQSVEYEIINEKICHRVPVKVQEPEPREKNGNITAYTIIPVYGEDLDEPRLFTCEIAECGLSEGQFAKEVDVDPNKDKIRFQVQARTSAGLGLPLRSEEPQDPRKLCPPEIPPGDGDNSLRVPEDQTGVDSTKQLKVTVDLDFFTNNSNGDITFTGIIVSDADLADDDTAVNDIQTRNDLDNIYRPWAERVDGDQLGPYRATEDTWDPSKLVTGRQKRAVNPEYVIGADNSCDKNDANTYCNGPLKSGRSYKVRSVRCSAGGCMVSKYATGEPPQLGVPPDIGLIVGMTIFALLLVAVIVGALYMWRSKRWPFKESSSSNDRTTGYNGAHENPIFEPEGKPDVVNALYFPEYVKDLHKDSGLKFTEQYESIKTHCAKKSMDVSTEPENRAKNRYVNILPFDFSRVKLLPQDDVPGSDYINANYMPGYNGPREFIATQGPLVCTMNDFWRMVWEQRSHIIVMLTQLTQQGRSKCDQYWPKGNEPVYYGDLAVKTVSESVLGDYTIRILEVQLGTDKRTIKQFHMTSWPDFGCPDTTDILLNFTRVVRADVRPGAGSITVHCSAGVGRTGTYIAVDRLLQHIETHDDIDIYGITMEMRDYRSYMVQTEDQYIYIHDCLKDVLEARNKQEDEDENIYENTGQTPQVEEEENIYENSNHKGNVTTDPNGHHYDNHKKALHRMSSPP